MRLAKVTWVKDGIERSEKLFLVDDDDQFIHYESGMIFDLDTMVNRLKDVGTSYVFFVLPDGEYTVGIEAHEITNIEILEGES